MAALFGPVITNVPSMDALDAVYRRDRYSAIKIVTGWGCDEGWNDLTRQRLYDLSSRVIVRTTAGDPSNTNASWVPNAGRVVQELRPWVEQRPNLWVEIGNEPDVAGYHEDTIWLYRYYLLEAIQAVRVNFPQAKIIGPAVRVNTPDLCGDKPGWVRWVEILADALNQCDSVGVHLYGFHSLNQRSANEDTGQVFLADELYSRLFPSKTLAITELGINHPPMPAQAKLAAYRTFARDLPRRYTWAMAYHLNARSDLHAEYCLPV